MTGRPHRAVRVDNNQSEIVADLRKLGAVVWRLSDLGGDVLDLLVCWRGKCIPVEVKQPGLKHTLTTGERESIQALRAIGVRAIVATCIEDVVEAWDRPRWRVIDQGRVKKLNDAMGDALMILGTEAAASRWGNEKRERWQEALQSLIRAQDLLCEVLEWE